MDSTAVESLAVKYQALKPVLDERARRLWAATEASAIGRGGISRVAEATGLTHVTIRAGLRQLRQPTATPDPPGPARRVRRPGGGRKPLTHHDPGLMRALEALVEPLTRGDPQSPLRWTCKSAAKLAAELTRQGHTVSPRSVNTLLGQLGYSLQSNRKTREGNGHPDRNAQFEHINRRVQSYQRRGQPVVSVDTKKKELVGDFKNGGREWQPKGCPEEVRIHDFPDPKLGKAIPYGVYDLAANTGWVSVGVDHDTAEFAVETLRRWWRHMGRPMYPGATQLLITADGGGSNGSRCRLWKVKLQELADETGLRITVCHFPPGTSKWNKIEHRMFCHITQNWRGRPLVDHEIVVNLIGSTTTETGLEIRAELDGSTYAIGREVTKQQMDSLSIQREKFHGDWNYTIRPRDRK
jgi:Rhodopirellula transposase DDE domain